MALEYGYHITDKSSIKSILKNGLVPNIGKNSRSVKEQNFSIYFTTSDFIDTWIKRFELDKTKIVILKFPYDKAGKRYDSANDYFTYENIPSESITVIDDNEELTLEKFYQKNKKLIDLEAIKKTEIILKKIIDRLKKIDSTSLDSEDDWDYNEVDPNLIDVLDALTIIRDIDDKSQFINILDSIKTQTLKKLCLNNLEITPESEIYKLLDIIFNDSLSDNPKLDLMFLNISTILVSVDLFYRQLNRYKRTGKKYGEDNRIWNLDTLYKDPISNIINNDEILKNVMNEIIMIQNNKEHINR